MRLVHRNCSHYPKKAPKEVSTGTLAKFMLSALITCACLTYMVVSDRLLEVKKVEAQMGGKIVSALVSATPTITPTPTVAPTEEEQIVSYIKTIFRNDWKMACAIARAESGLRTKARLVSSVEKSIGIFQINLENETTKVHFHRVPGKTLEEKIQWLENPYNNTLMAFWIASAGGNGELNWNPWSVYTKGWYEVKLEDCK